MSEELQSSYDRVAANYAEQFRDEMDKKPFDRKMLDWLAEKVLIDPLFYALRGA
jgi:hypothetical protein